MSGPAADDSGAANGAPALRAFLLGRFELVLHGRAIPDHAWRRHKARQLLKCLLIRPRQRISRDEAFDLFWPDSDPEAAATNLRSERLEIRRVLRQYGLDGAEDPVPPDRRAVVFQMPGGVWTDADEVDRLVAEAHSSSDPLPLLEQADARFRGELLPADSFEEWAVERRRALQRAWTETQLRLAHLREANGEADRAADALVKLLDTDPCDERAAQELMLLLARHGRRADAIRVSQRLVQALRAELQVEPSAATLDILRRVTEGDVPSPSVVAAPPEDIDRAEFVCSLPFPTPPQVVGRGAELAHLGDLVGPDRAAGMLLMIGAPAGIGKSTLVGALLRRARTEGVLCLAGGSYEHAGATILGPYRDALTDFLLSQPPDRLSAQLTGLAGDLSAIIPELRYHLGMPDAFAERRPDAPRLFAAVHAMLRLLTEHGPVLLCLEDLHVADEASLQLTRYLVRQTRRLPLTLVATYRPEQTPHGGQLAQMIAALQRDRVIEHVVLRPLGAEDTGRMVSALLGAPASDSLAGWLYSTTEGNALFVEQLVLSLKEQNQIDLQAGIWHGSPQISQEVPPIIREVIGQRLRGVSDACRRTLAMAAVLGRAVQHETLLEALVPRREHEVLDDLEEALGALLLHPTPSGYAFSHALVRETVYWEIDQVRRMQLHGHAGLTLERLAGPRSEDLAVELAHHFALAERLGGVRAKAIRYSLQAGRRSAGLSAHSEALEHFSRACDLIAREGELADPATLLEALDGRGQAQRELAQWVPCISTFRRVLELGAQRVQRARARGAIVHALRHLGDTSAALEECETGLAELKAVDDDPDMVVARLRLQWGQAFLWFLRGRYRDLVELGQRMLRSATELGRPRPLVWARSAIGWGHLGQGHVDETLDQYAHALAEAERSNDKTELAILHDSIGIQNFRGGRFSEARAHLDRAIALHHESASDVRAVNAIQTLGRLALAEGSLSTARGLADHALGLAMQGADRWAAECFDLQASIHATVGEWQEAEARFADALRIRRQVGHAAGIAESLVSLGFVYQRRGEWSHALEMYQEAVDVTARIDACPQALAALRHLGRLLLRMGLQRRATDLIERASALGDDMQQSLEYAATLLAQAELLWLGGDRQSAAALARRSLDVERCIERAVEARAILAAVLATDFPSQARSQATEALEQARRVGAPYLLGLGSLALARATAAVDGPRASSSSFQEAISQFEQAGTPYERALATRDYAATLAVESGEQERANALLDQAAEQFRRLGARPAEVRTEEIRRDPRIHR